MGRELDDERFVWSSPQGDGVVRSWTQSAASRTYDIASLLVQMRNTKTNALIASSKVAEQTGGVLAFDTSTCDFTGPTLTFGFKLPRMNVPVSIDYVIEAECEVDGVLTTFFSHAWEIRKQYAVAVTP